MMLGDAMTPFDPVLGDAMTPFYPILVGFLSKLKLKLPSVFVEITSVEVPVFEITLLYPNEGRKTELSFCFEIKIFKRS